MANTTAIASGTNRYCATPLKNTTGTNTIQIDNVATSAGVAICCAPSKIARLSGLPCPRLRWMFSISTVASSTRIPTARDRPPKVMMLKVCPKELMTMIETKIERGIETATIAVLRQLPKKTRIINAVRHAAISPSLITPSIEALTNRDWSNKNDNFSSFGTVAWI